MSWKARLSSDSDVKNYRPIYVVWEVTLACNLKCMHCGSRAGQKRGNELTINECVTVIEQLRQLGTREITLIGGEAYMRSDWLTLISEISDRGIMCGMQTGARALTEEKIAAAASVGLTSAGVSIDGLADVHDQLRGVPGSFDQALKVLQLFRKHGLSGTVNTQINTRNLPQLRDLFDTIVEAGATAWQVQLTVPMGNAADNPDLLLQPYQVLDLMPLLAELYIVGRLKNCRIVPGNNIGYFGPYEAMWRGVTGRREYYSGCKAGRTVLGIESDGSIKGCPSLPTEAYVGGNVRDQSIADILSHQPELGFTRDHERNQQRLWGYCKSCYYSDICQSGCTWTTHVLSGRPGNNPYCHYRALQLKQNNLREVVVIREKATGRPFDHGRFEVRVEGGHGVSYTQEDFSKPELAHVFQQKQSTARTLTECPRCTEYVREGSHSCHRCD